jgi:rhomboid protease GluP
MARSYAGSYIIGLVVIGFLPFGIDNYAHAGGFAGGYLTARLLNPMKAERADHMIIAMTCLAASLLSIVVSVIHGAPLLRP